MFRITEGLVQSLAKNYKNVSMVSVAMDKVGVMAAYSGSLCVCVLSSLYTKALPSYTVNFIHAQRVRICCHNTDLVHVNAHNRNILVIFSQALYKALCYPKHVGAILNILYFNFTYILYIVNQLDNKVFNYH